jgi:hypothetical protein
MIIWGTRGREKTVDYGSFHCPNCRCSSPYEQRRVSTYFTLYFIPLFPISSHGEYVQCGQCSGAYDVAILDITPEQLAAMTAPWHCECGNNNPAEYDACLSCGMVRVLGDQPSPAQIYE